MISFLPNLGLAAILLVGGRMVIHHSLTVGQFTAFYAYLLMLISPMRTLGYMLGAAQRATASGARIFQVLDRAPRLTAPDDAPALPAGDGRVSFENVSLTFVLDQGTTLSTVPITVPHSREVIGTLADLFPEAVGNGYILDWFDPIDRVDWYLYNPGWVESGGLYRNTSNLCENHRRDNGNIFWTKSSWRMG